MSGGRKRGSAGGPGKAPPPPPAGRSAGAEKAQPPLKSPKGKKIAANNNDARADALAEAQAMAEAVADPADCDAVDGNKMGMTPVELHLHHLRLRRQARSAQRLWSSTRKKMRLPCCKQKKSVS